MVNVDEAVIARLKTHGENFEILVDAELAYAYKAGDEVDFEDLLAAQYIFKDAGKADKASEEVMQEIFSTQDVKTIIGKIIEKGEIQLTTEKKKKILENKTKQVINIIARNAINPQTGAPHPPDRIQKAMDEAKIHIDISKNPKEQVEPVLKAIRPLIPIKFETVQMAVKIPGEYAGKIYKTLHDYGEIKKEDWKGESQFVMIEIPGGLQDEFISALSGQTHGDVEVKKIEKNE